MKRICILIGFKGSGKSFTGMLFEELLQFKFIRVEDWAKHVKKDRSIDNDDYLKEVFQVIENGIRDSLKKFDNVVFESTGLTRYFDSMLNNLRTDFKVTTVKINADKDLCMERVRTRDQSIHINVSDNEVKMINDAVAKKMIQTDFEIDNNNSTKNELKEQISEIVKMTI